MFGVIGSLASCPVLNERGRTRGRRGSLPRRPRHFSLRPLPGQHPTRLLGRPPPLAGDRTGVALSSGWVLLSRAKNLSIACGEVINLLPTRSASSLTSTPEPVWTPTKCHRRPVAEWIVPVDGWSRRTFVRDF